MSALPKNYRPLALVFSDLHLSTNRPIARADSFWIVEQCNLIREVCDIHQQATKEHGTIPIICAGDVFDSVDLHSSKHRSGCWQILQQMLQRFHKQPLLAVPGQHDLRNHNYEHLEATPYGLLMQAGAIKDLSGLVSWSVDPGDRCGFKYRLPLNDDRRYGVVPWHTPRDRTELRIVGFGWDAMDAGQVSERIGNFDCEGAIKVAITHQYVYANAATNPAQFTNGNILDVSETFKGFDVVFAGDNHTPFAYRRSAKHPLIINCGAMQATTIRQKNHKPKVYLLCSTPQGFEVVGILLANEIAWAATEVLRLIEANNGALQDVILGMARVGDRFTSASISTALQGYLKTIGKAHLSNQLIPLINAIRTEEGEVEV